MKLHRALTWIIYGENKEFPSYLILQLQSPRSPSVITRTSPLGCVIIKMKSWFLFFKRMCVVEPQRASWVEWIPRECWEESPEWPSEAERDSCLVTGLRECCVKCAAPEVWKCQASRGGEGIATRTQTRNKGRQFSTEVRNRSSEPDNPGSNPSAVT